MTWQTRIWMNIRFYLNNCPDTNLVFLVIKLQAVGTTTILALLGVLRESSSVTAHPLSLDQSHSIQFQISDNQLQKCPQISCFGSGLLNKIILNNVFPLSSNVTAASDIVSDIFSTSSSSSSSSSIRPPSGPDLDLCYIDQMKEMNYSNPTDPDHRETRTGTETWLAIPKTNSGRRTTINNG